MSGRRHGRERLSGIDAFVTEDGGSTTLAAAVAMLVSLALVFSLANAQWVSSRAADVQAVADAGALAGMNVLSGYVTTAQVLDALVLSLGLVGMLTMAIGLVVSAIPVVSSAGPPVVQAAVKVFEARSRLSRSAAQGLERLEGVLPYLMSANSLLAVRANSGDGGSYVGVAVPYPLEGSSDFGSLARDEASGKAQQAGSTSERLDELSRQAQEAKERADEALLRGWMADCGSRPNCMRERAEALAGLSGALNPDYPSVDGWDFAVPLARARAYYQARMAAESPEDGSARELARSQARLAFYRYASERLASSSVTRGPDGSVTCDLAELPRNTADVRETTLYTDASWPCTDEDGVRTLHCSPSCPGASGAPSGSASLADEESGAVSRCDTCQFDVVDVGRAPAASTSIENGFEHHWREVVLASEDYEARLAEQLEREREAKGEAERGRDLFSQALEQLGTVRVELSPPGRFGCVCVAADPRTRLAPSQLAAFAGGGAELPARVAVAGATLAPDESTSGANVLAGFFDGMVAQGGFVGGAGSALDAVMGAWGGLLASYDDGYQAFMAGANETFARLSQLGLGGVTTWLRDALSSVIELTGMAPADLTPRKPVLTNSANVMRAAGNDWYGALRGLVELGPSLSEADGPAEALAALGVFVRDATGQGSITVAEIPVPGTGRTIPLEVDLEWLTGEAA